MAEVKWIKITTDMFDNKKIKLIESLPEADSILVIWVKLLSLAGQVNENGYLFFTEGIPYTDEMLSTIFRRPLNIVRLALQTFERFKMITIQDQIICITNWEKYQNIEGMDKLREYNRIAKQKERERKKLLLENVNDMSMTANKCQGTDIDIDIDKDKEKDVVNKSNIFKVFEDEFGRLLSPMEYQKIKSWNYDNDIILEALKKAVENGVLKLNYIDSILLNWEKQNLRTIREIQDHEKAYTEKKLKLVTPTETQPTPEEKEQKQLERSINSCAKAMEMFFGNNPSEQIIQEVINDPSFNYDDPRIKEGALRKLGLERYIGGAECIS